MLRRLATASTAVVIVAVLLAATAFAVVVRRPFPDTSGEAELPGLEAPVDVDRDERGVAHIAADTAEDLFRAQGYVHAQDRFWQMDVWRHIAQGRGAELFGETALPGDRFLRTLGWADIAAQEWDAMPAAERSWLSAYAEGVNAYLRDRSAGELAVHYTVLTLGGTRYEPAPWHPVDTLTFHKLLSWDLRSNVDNEIERVRLSASLDDEEITDLFPPYPDGHPVIVEDGEAAAAPPPQPPALPAGAGAALRRAAARLGSAARALGPASGGVGSNSWALSAERTTTGAPLLANDPHLGIQMPSIWYQVGLRCRARGDDCPFEVTGFSFAGSPGVVIGHTDRIAWGFTNLGADVMDLAVERLHPDDPERYDAGGEWRGVETSRETIRVAGGPDEELTVRRTRNGPLIAQAYGLDDWQGTAVEPPDRYDVALRWTALEPSTTLRAMLGINRATDWEGFREAASHLDVPGQNLVYADVDGNIGYQATGRVPVRAGGDGRWPVPGWDDDYAWTGWVPFEGLPSIVNPESGFVATANNPVVDDGHPHLLTADWGYGYRADRIEALLEGAGPLSPDDVEAMMLDTWSPNAERLVPELLALPPGDDRVESARAVLDGWDRRKDADSPGAALFAAFWRHLLDRVFADRVPAGTEPAGGGRWFAVVDRLLDEPGSRWWSHAGGTPEEVLAAALTDAVDELAERLGPDPSGWRWGDLHTATFRDPTLGESGIAAVETLLNRGSQPLGGGSEVVNAIGWNAAAGYEVNWLPSMRMVVDLADVDHSRAIHTTGQSGHPYHRHYTDLIDDWAGGRFRPMSLRAAGAAEHLRLVPG